MLTGNIVEFLWVSLDTLAYSCCFETGTVLSDEAQTAGERGTRLRVDDGFVRLSFPGVSIYRSVG